MRIIDRIIDVLSWLGDKIYCRCPDEESVLCNCTEHPFESMVFFEAAPLADGSWTQFFVAKCSKCGGLDGFPRQNFLHAVQEGTDETLKSLRDAGVDVEKVRLVLRYRLDDM